MRRGVVLARVEWVQGPAAMESGNLGKGGEGGPRSLAVSQWRRGEQHAPTVHRGPGRAQHGDT